MELNRFVVISGCSGGGKSALLDELRQRGYATIQEPGRRIVREEVMVGGAALPWVDQTAFARRAISMSLADRMSAAAHDDWTFFDRGLIDAAVALQHQMGKPAFASLGLTHRYNQTVFLTPPWPELYVTDSERRHDLNSAVAEYARLLEAYQQLGYDVFILPKVGVSERADLVLDVLTHGRRPN